MLPKGMILKCELWPYLKVVSERHIVECEYFVECEHFGDVHAGPLLNARHFAAELADLTIQLVADLTALHARLSV